MYSLWFLGYQQVKTSYRHFKKSSCVLMWRRMERLTKKSCKWWPIVLLMNCMILTGTQSLRNVIRLEMVFLTSKNLLVHVSIEKVSLTKKTSRLLFKFLIPIEMDKFHSMILMIYFVLTGVQGWTMTSGNNYWWKQIKMEMEWYQKKNSRKRWVKW